MGEKENIMNNKEKIAEAKHIIGMLECDEIDHDEVNARFECLIYNEEYTCLEDMACWSFYTTSYDACHSITPKGWYYYMSHNVGIYSLVMHKGEYNSVISDYDIQFLGENHTSMPIAWLEAILQAMIWELEND